MLCANTKIDSILFSENELWSCRSLFPRSSPRLQSMSCLILPQERNNHIMLAHWSWVKSCQTIDTIAKSLLKKKFNYMKYAFWMNDAFYIALYCVLLYTQRALQSCGGGGLSSTTSSVQHPLGWCDGCHSTTAPVRSPHTSYRWRGERVIEPIKWMGIIRRPWLISASGGKLDRTPGLHPYSLREVPWDF